MFPLVSSFVPYHAQLNLYADKKKYIFQFFTFYFYESFYMNI